MATFILHSLQTVLSANKGRVPCAMTGLQTPPSAVKHPVTAILRPLIQYHQYQLQCPAGWINVLLSENII
jgi:hypothetical protein